MFFAIKESETMSWENEQIARLCNGKIVNRWGAFSFYDILTDLGLVPPLWELHKRLHQEP